MYTACFVATGWHETMAAGILTLVLDLQHHDVAAGGGELGPNLVDHHADPPLHLAFPDRIAA